MAYTTVAEMITRYGADYVTASCDRDQDGSVDTSALERAIEDASARIDTRIAVRYEVPIAPAPAVLASLCGDMAVYLASTDPLALTDDKRERYKDALKLLEAIAAGNASLGTVDEPVTTTVTRPRYVVGDRLFTRTTMDGL